MCLRKPRMRPRTHGCVCHGCVRACARGCGGCVRGRHGRARGRRGRRAVRGQAQAAVTMLPATRRPSREQRFKIGRGKKLDLLKRPWSSGMGGRGGEGGGGNARACFRSGEGHFVRRPLSCNAALQGLGASTLRCAAWAYRGRIALLAGRGRWGIPASAVTPTGNRETPRPVRSAGEQWGHVSPLPRASSAALTGTDACVPVARGGA